MTTTPLALRIDHTVDTVLRLAAEADGKTLVAYVTEAILRTARVQAVDTKNDALARAVDGAQAALTVTPRFRPGAELIHAPVSGVHGQILKTGKDRSIEVKGTTKQCGPGEWAVFDKAGTRVGSVLRLTPIRWVARRPGERQSQMCYSFSAAAAALLKETP